MPVSGCSQKRPSEITALLESSDPLTVTAYQYEISLKDYKTMKTVSIGARIAACDTLDFSQLGDDEEYIEKAIEFCEEYETISGAFTVSLINYLESSAYEETESEPGNDDLAFMIETEDNTNIYFYTTDEMKVVSDTRKVYKVDSMTSLLEDFDHALTAYQELFE